MLAGDRLQLPTHSCRWTGTSSSRKSNALQALEVATWGALLRAPRAVLAGDHLQLPPTIISEEAANKASPTIISEEAATKAVVFHVMASSCGAGRTPPAAAANDHLGSSREKASPFHQSSPVRC